MRKILALLSLLVAVPAGAAGGRYDDYSLDALMGLSKQMAVCAGDEETTATHLQEANEGETAEIYRDSSEGFFHCAWYLRSLHGSRDPARVLVGGNAARQIKLNVEEEVERASILFNEVMEKDDLDGISRHLEQCRALDDERNACLEDQRRLAEEMGFTCDGPQPSAGAGQDSAERKLQPCSGPTGNAKVQILNTVEEALAYVAEADVTNGLQLHISDELWKDPPGTQITGVRIAVVVNAVFKRGLLPGDPFLQKDGYRTYYFVPRSKFKRPP
ncbi:MAG TPA: hypothetical protein VJM31_17830 [Vicinamibacterales bacterium]|nr:hypothetical protein [Vicinamibacterales bacterium]